MKARPVAGQVGSAVPRGADPGRLQRDLVPAPERVWYQGHWLSDVLAPLGWLYCALASLRRWAYRRGLLASFSATVPVFVVGNLTVGGTGKTPLVLWIADFLARKGYRPGIALRGYGAEGRGRPRHVTANADARVVGDEAVLLARRSGCPVVAGRDRVAAARRLADHCGCDVVVTDDGLQHYRLRRQLEILVSDGQRGLGNGRCLPAGPLREPRRRLDAADVVVINGAGEESDGCRMRLEPGAAVNLHDPTVQCPLDRFIGEPVTAIAGIGHPRRFFTMLEDHGLFVTAIPYPDHHRFRASDIARWPSGTVLMTEKDAVKCQPLASAAHWFVPVTAVPNAAFVIALEQALAAMKPAASEPG